MQKSEPLKVSSVPNFEIYLHSINIKESIELAKMGEKQGFYEQIKYVLENVSNLDNKQLESILLVDAVELLLFYRVFFWEDADLSLNPVLKPSDFFHSERNSEEDFITIGEHRFTNQITLNGSISAEAYCLSKKHKNIMNLYVMASGCMKTLKRGIDTILDLDDNTENKDTLEEYNNMLSKVGGLKINFLPNTEDNVKEYSKIALLTKEGTGNYALYPRDSNILEFGL